jgi:hypothetical protein
MFHIVLYILFNVLAFIFYILFFFCVKINLLVCDIFLSLCSTLVAPCLDQFKISFHYDHIFDWPRRGACTRLSRVRITSESRPRHVRVTSESRPSHVRVTSESRPSRVRVASVLLPSRSESHPSHSASGPRPLARPHRARPECGACGGQSGVGAPPHCPPCPHQ